MPPLLANALSYQTPFPINRRQVRFAMPMNEPTYQLTRSHGVGYAVAGFSRACLIRLIDFPDMPLRTNVHETVKVGGTAILVRTEFPVENRRISAAYKRVRRRNWWKVLTGFFRTNRQLRTWRLGRELLEHNITTPRPLAVIVPRWYQLGVEAYLAIEWVDGARNLRQVALSLSQFTSTTRRSFTHAAARSIGELIARMHEAQISHRDLKATNLLLRKTASGVESYVIDLDGAARHLRRLGWHQRFCNLARLELSSRELPAISNADRLRLLKAYLNASAAPKPQWKTAWQELSEIAGQRALRPKRRAA